MHCIGKDEASLSFINEGSLERPPFLRTHTHTHTEIGPAQSVDSGYLLIYMGASISEPPN